MRTLIFDLETNEIDNEDVKAWEGIDRVHVLALYDVEKEKYERYDKEDVAKGVARLAEADCLVGHNILGFDIPVLRKLYPDAHLTDNLVDTLVLGRLAFPDIKKLDYILFKKGLIPGKLMGKHSLEAYGYRLGVLKGEYKHTADWTKWSQEMSDYCVQDVKVTVALVEKLKAKKLDPVAAQIELAVAKIIKRQEWHGWLFNKAKAESLYQKLIEEREPLDHELRQMFPPRFVRDGKVFTPKQNNKAMGYVKDCPLSKIKMVPFNPGSRQQLAYWLQKRFGWIPTEYSDNGEPILDDEIIGALPYPEAPKIARFLLLNKRIGQLAEGKRAWLKYIKKDGRIHGAVISNGCVSGRMSHEYPNVAQVPKVGSPFGEECRELFEVPEGKKLVGVDASGLELRCLAHYLAKFDGGKYANTILEGDIHSANQEAAGLPTRDKAKRFIYAFLYGAGNPLLGSIIGKGAASGASIRKKFLAKTAGLNSLTNALKEACKRGYLIGLDGRVLRIRYAYAALNLLLQSCGAILMKKALVILDEDLQNAGYVPGVDYEFVGNIHDEFQIEVNEGIADTVGKMAVEAIRKAGLFFNFRCALDGEYKVGNNWKETH